MRLIETHKINPANDVLQIEVVDDPGKGGASHVYRVTGYNGATNDGFDLLRWYTEGLEIIFQNGPIAEAGINGITNEALLAILIDRMEGFQSGPFASLTNEAALKHLRHALSNLHARTQDRMQRGVEGTHQP